ncbi:hypothetical protein ZIOFF_018006 [Zingiber officinale]|uniref:Uncharacterized protein n=1 Tax=Zingiber officinale TaxID=94328 RepID=A0A8J5H6A4_ZINOF|nr:hypothetical protein ZIOFF_018006 [Zingiber officinale]
MAGCNQGNIAPQGEEVMLVLLSAPLLVLRHDHERAYFDSADWVLGKQGTSPKSKTAVESLKPKLKRTPHHQLPPRKPACTTGVEDTE